MKKRRHTLMLSYQAALRHFLDSGSEAGLTRSLSLGRRAVALGLETADLALIHERALIPHVLHLGTPLARDRIIKRAKIFFAEAIVPLEQTHRVAIEANVHLSRLNRSLSRRTEELAASNGQLKQEISRRRSVEQSLRQSERNTGISLVESRRLQEQMRLLSRRVLSAQEDERKRISRELHDVIAQVLTGINVRLASLKLEATTNAKGLSGKITKTQKLVERSVDIVHRFARELRPAVLDDLGLIPALHSFIKSFTQETGVRVLLTAYDGVETLGNAQRIVLYRVAHEALTNVARHAKADRVKVTIHKRQDSIDMVIVDKGRGFIPKRILSASRYKRLGLLGIRERVEMVGGMFAVHSAPGKGTTIHVQMPVGFMDKTGRRKP